MKKRIEREDLKKIGYILTDFRRQEEFAPFDFVWVMTNGKNYIFEDGEVLTQQQIETFNKQSMEFYMSGTMEKHNLFMPIIMKSEEIDEKEILMGDIDITGIRPNGEPVHILKADKFYFYDENGKKLAKEYIKIA